MEKQTNKEQFKRVTLENDFDSLLSPVAVGSIVSVFTAYILKKHIGIGMAGGWCILLLLGGVSRLIVKGLYYRNQVRFSIDTWTKLYVGCTCFVATLWGIIPLLSIDKLPLEVDGIIVVILLGLSTGGAISHISNKFVALYYSNTIILAHIIKVFIEKSGEWYFLISAELIFVLLVAKVITKFNKAYKKSIFMAFELQNKIELEKELQKEKAKNYQNSKLASLGEMAAGIAHEINNPLTVALGKLQLLQKGISKGKATEEFLNRNITSALDSGRRVADIVESMRSLSRMKEDSELEPIDLDSVIKVCLPMVNQKLDYAGIDLINNNENIKFLGDLSEVSQVIINLINNAHDAIKEQKGERWIKITVEEENMIIIRITDSGQFKDPSLLEKIFDPFFTTKSVGEGTGLGLSLCRTLMERNQGHIEFDTKSLNTSFVLYFKKVI